MIAVLRLFAALAVVGLVAPLPARADSSDLQIIHVLNRIGFGPTVEAVAHVKEIGIDRYIDEQLDPDAIVEPAALTNRLAVLDTLGLGAAQLFTKFGPPPAETNDGMKPTQEVVDARIKRADTILQQSRAAR